jgi:hypothetical protein
MRGTVPGRTIGLAALGALLVLGAGAANSQGSRSLLAELGPFGTREVLAAGSSTSLAGPEWIQPVRDLALRLPASPLRFLRPGAPESPAGTPPPFSFRRSSGDGLLTIGALPEDSQMQGQLRAAFGLRKFSFRARSWRHVGTGPTVHAGTFSAVRDVDLPIGARTGIGASITVYRLGARFEPIYRKHPASIHLFVRILFGGPDAGSRGNPFARSTRM